MDPAAYGALPASACALGTAGMHGPDRITRTTYDDNGRPLTVTEGHGTAAAGLSARYAYTANGQLDWLEDGEGNRTDYQYDRLDRLSEINYANVSGGGVNWGDDEVFTYDGAGRLSSRTTRSNQVFSYTYDGLGRVTQVSAPSGTPGTSYTYDNFSNLLTASDGSMTITNTFDARGRRLSQTSANGTVSYQYDAAGRRTRMTWPDGFYVSYDYTVTSQLTHIRENGAATGVGVLAAFEYDDLGRRTSLTRGNGTVTDYSYDAAGRLDQLVQDLAGTANDNTDAFAYNPAGQIVSSTRSNTGYSFASHINTDTLFNHNGLNEIISVTGEAAPSYDARGNMTAYGGKTFTYDQYNRLTGSSDGTVTVSLSYDPLGRFHLYDIGVVQVSALYDGADVIAQYNLTAGVMGKRYVHGPGVDEPLVEYAGSGTSNRTFLHADARGSIIAHSDSTGALTATLTYDEYGNPGPTDTGQFQYTGQVWLQHVGVYHYKNRAYHPGLMRFMQTDPIGHSGGINLYAYVGGDPVNHTDPWGLFPWSGGDDDDPPETEDVITVIGVRFCPDGATCISGDDLFWFMMDRQDTLIGVSPTDGWGIGSDRSDERENQCGPNGEPAGYTTVPHAPGTNTNLPNPYMRGPDGRLHLTPAWREAVAADRERAQNFVAPLAIGGWGLSAASGGVSMANQSSAPSPFFRAIGRAAAVAFPVTAGATAAANATRFAPPPPDGPSCGQNQ
ncbi:MAG: RHS repeat-associated core domain-containing protein [Oceanicaulis sp.]